MSVARRRHPPLLHLACRQLARVVRAVSVRAAHDRRTGLAREYEYKGARRAALAPGAARGREECARGSDNGWAQLRAPPRGKGEDARRDHCSEEGVVSKVEHTRPRC